jgi:hypothetical protein
MLYVLLSSTRPIPDHNTKFDNFHKAVMDASQVDGQVASLFSTAGSYGIQTLAEPENTSVEYDVHPVGLITLISNA